MIPLQTSQSSGASQSPFYLYKFKQSDRTQLDDYKIFPSPSKLSVTEVSDNILNYNYRGSGRPSLQVSYRAVTYKSPNTLDTMNSIQNSEAKHIDLPPISSILNLNNTPMNKCPPALSSFPVIDKSVSSVVKVKSITPITPLTPRSPKIYNNLESLSSYILNPIQTCTFKTISDAAEGCLKERCDSSESERNFDYSSKRLTVKCPYVDCNYTGSFLSRDYLRRHIREQHRQTKGHFCKGVNPDGSLWGCFKKFKRPYQLINHWRGQRSLKKCSVPGNTLLNYGISREKRQVKLFLKRHRLP